MTAAPKIYTRLTRNAAGLVSYASLWLAADHVMIVSSSGYNEAYSRVMLRDMKAIFITPTGRRLWWGIVWSTLATIFGVWGITSWWSGDSPSVSSVGFILAGGALLWNSLLGQGCRVYLDTGVQTTVLPSLVRIKKTRRVLARLQPLIVAAQADLVATAPAPSPIREIPATETPSVSIPPSP